MIARRYRPFGAPTTTRRARLDPDNLLHHLPALEAKAARLRAKEMRARRRAERLELRIHGIRLVAGLSPRERALSAVPSPADGGDSPYGVGAIRRVLHESPSRVWSAGLLHLELEARGWVSPTARHRLQGTEAALSRLVRSGELERVQRGRYRLSPGGAASRPSVAADGRSGLALTGGGP